MKKLLLVLAVACVFNSYAQAEIALESKQVIFDEIANYVFFEDEGYVRAPESLNDFKYTVVDELVISIKGESYSAWDDKVLSYDCTATVVGKGMIKSAADIELACKVTGENWPYFSKR